MKTIRTLALLFIVALTTTTLKAQTTFPATWSSSNVDMEFRSDGTFIIKGLDTALGLSGTDVGAGTRMLWYPNLSAFRAGTVTGTAWDLAHIGQYSFAVGLDTTASATGAISMGANNSASSTDAIAIGSTSSATGPYSIVIGGSSTANGQSSVVVGNGNLTYWQGGTAIGNACNGTGYCATAIGLACNATSNWALAIGNSANATGFSAVALSGCTSAGQSSFSTGSANLSSGDRSASFGGNNVASSYSSFVLGQYNVGGSSSSTTWVTTDPLLELGNGTSSSATSDALIVYKNGSATFQGTVRVQPTSDIPVFTGN